MKIVVCGAAGRMGKAILSVIDQEEDFLLGAVIDKVSVNADPRQLEGVTITNAMVSAIVNGEVVIDFSSPSGTLAILQEAVSQKKPMVIGTTGFTQEEKEVITAASKKIPIVLSPNMSVGVNVIFKLLADVASVLGGDGYDVEIVEMHHRQKKDAPSGTALRMGEVIASARGTTLPEVGRFSRHGIIGERPNGEIGIQSLRGGDVVGEHTVYFVGDGERIEIAHRAHSRKHFARGALIAAQWVVKQKPGLYDMMDVLNLKKG
jgi:4-hydroxy-tetrahydrodipicolinate reductase